jgi:hypothetical protein
MQTASFASVARVQACSALAALAAVLASTAVVWTCATSHQVGRFVERPTLARFMNTNLDIYHNKLGYLDIEDRMILDDLEHADYSKGGVYFFGSSTIKWGTLFWELPADIQPYVKNYGIGACNWQFVSQFIHYLVEEKGLLQAGGDKVHVVLCESFTMSITPRAPFVDLLWKRYGLYDYDQQGLRPRVMGPLERSYRLNKAICSSFVQARMDQFERSLVPRGLLNRHSQIARLDAESAGTLNGDWQGLIDTQTAYLDDLLTYLRDRGVQVTVVRLPLASWHGRLPFPAATRDAVEGLCRKHDVPFVDLGRLWSDDEFFDSSHGTYRGLQQQNAALMKIVEPHLRKLNMPLPREFWMPGSANERGRAKEDAAAAK